jgi:hypothetical protein
MQRLADTLGLDINLEPGMWLSDTDEDIAITPDGAENIPFPTWAVETKAIASELHLKFVIRDRKAKLQESYKAIDSVPNEGTTCFREQVIQYFVTNEHLKTLYFVLYDDRVALEPLVFHYITIKREDILDEIETQGAMEISVLDEVNKLVAEISEWEE